MVGCSHIAMSGDGRRLCWRLQARQEDEMSWGEVGAQSSTLRVLGIALVANAFITDGQEIFLNYRYNPFLRRPSWYHPVDAEEEDRLWRTRGHRVVQ